MYYISAHKTNALNCLTCNEMHDFLQLNKHYSVKYKSHQIT